MKISASLAVFPIVMSLVLVSVPKARAQVLYGSLVVDARVTSTPHFGNPNANVSNLLVNPDGTVRNLGGFSSITTTANTGREGIDERLVRLGLRLGF